LPPGALTVRVRFGAEHAISYGNKPVRPRRGYGFYLSPSAKGRHTRFQRENRISRFLGDTSSFMPDTHKKETIIGSLKK